MADPSRMLHGSWRPAIKNIIKNICNAERIHIPCQTPSNHLESISVRPRKPLHSQGAALRFLPQNMQIWAPRAKRLSGTLWLAVHAVPKGYQLSNRQVSKRFLFHTDTKPQQQYPRKNPVRCASNRMGNPTKRVIFLQTTPDPSKKDTAK